ncbi:GntR family transcriptional regulator [Pseudomonas sp. nanlin1]|uniref:GntR family transcriptional regulator n=1 Tax=Pseudomonas sp. nanlin1 TaxID=3040605 RepID=UPI00388E0EF5
MTPKPSLSNILVSEKVPAHLARSMIEEKLRTAILDGRLPRGMAVRQQELASLYGVSRMPVREALRQLEAQGLLQVTHHKGAVVAPLISDDAEETYALRILLEREALRLSLPLLEQQNYDEALYCIDAMEESTDYSQLATLNRRFHMELYCKAPNKRLLRLIDQGLYEEERFMRFNLGTMGLGKIAQDDHRSLLAAVCQKDIDTALVLLEQHLHRGVDAIRRYTQNMP